jgi:hypothetical protein
VIRPLLFLTIALSAAQGSPDEGATTDSGKWPRPNDREPADDWSERTGIPSPFPCRAEIVWCDAAPATPINPDGTTCGAWVAADEWRESTEPAQESPTVDVLLTAVRDLDEAEAIVEDLLKHGVGAWVVPAAGTEHGFAVFAKAKAATFTADRPSAPPPPLAGETVGAYNARLASSGFRDARIDLDAGTMKPDHKFDPWRVSDGPIASIGSWVPADAAYTAPPSVAVVDADDSH